MSPKVINMLSLSPAGLRTVTSTEPPPMLLLVHDHVKYSNPPCMGMGTPVTLPQVLCGCEEGPAAGLGEAEEPGLAEGEGVGESEARTKVCVMAMSLQSVICPALHRITVQHGGLKTPSGYSPK